MRERAPTPYTRAGKLLALARDLHRFCKQHHHEDLSGGLTFAELHEVQRQFADAMEWVRQLGADRTPNGRAAEHVPAERTPVDDECF